MGCEMTNNRLSYIVTRSYFARIFFFRLLAHVEKFWESAQQTHLKIWGDLPPILNQPPEYVCLPCAFVGRLEWNCQVPLDYHNTKLCTGWCALIREFYVNQLSLRARLEASTSSLAMTTTTTTTTSPHALCTYSTTWRICPRLLFKFNTHICYVNLLKSSSLSLWSLIVQSNESAWRCSMGYQNGWWSLWYTKVINFCVDRLQRAPKLFCGQSSVKITLGTNHKPDKNENTW